MFKKVVLGVYVILLNWFALKRGFRSLVMLPELAFTLIYKNRILRDMLAHYPLIPRKAPPVLDLASSPPYNASPL